VVDRCRGSNLFIHHRSGGGLCPGSHDRGGEEHPAVRTAQTVQTILAAAYWQQVVHRLFGSVSGKRLAVLVLTEWAEFGQVARQA
jgi:hypothetical protein